MFRRMRFGPLSARRNAHKNPDEAHAQEIGDAYTFIALESHMKLILAWHLGKRTRVSTEDFIAKLRTATADCRFQISTDAFAPYLNSIDDGLSDRADYSQVVKVNATEEDGREARYSPGEVTQVVKTPILGVPDMPRSCKAHVERQNGSLRQWCKRLTRLTYAFKKWENLQSALALHFAFYNFWRIHGTLRVTPAMEVGIADHIWDLEELING
jgi:IS1 family transposase